jgi:hypothetical protein
MLLLWTEPKIWTELNVQCETCVGIRVIEQEMLVFLRQQKEDRFYTSE